MVVLVVIWQVVIKDTADLVVAVVAVVAIVVWIPYLNRVILGNKYTSR
jgi:hypothetical protein